MFFFSSTNKNRVIFLLVLKPGWKRRPWNGRGKRF